MGEWPGSGAKLSPSGLKSECGARGITSEKELQLRRNATSQLSNYVTLSGSTAGGCWLWNKSSCETAGLSKCISGTC